MNRWMTELKNEWLDEWNKWVIEYIWVNELINEWMNCWVDEWRNELMKEWKAEWMDEWMYFNCMNEWDYFQISSLCYTQKCNSMKCAEIAAGCLTRWLE